MKVYLDNAATTAIEPQVIEEMNRIMRDFYGNPSSIHSLGRATRNEIEQARKKVAYHIGASLGEVFFTSGGTESNNMAIKCAVRDMGVRRIITSPIEHHCVLHSVECQQRTAGVEVVWLNVDKEGHIDLGQLEKELATSDKCTLVTLMHANNEIGTVLDIEKVGDLCKEHGAFFHSDTVQSVAHFPINVSDLNVHFISGGAHKFHGPKGVGFVYINSDCQIKPFIDGGAQAKVNLKERFPVDIGQEYMMDYIMGHNAGALWDQMTADKD
jgi:cysteine desulfurase